MITAAFKDALRKLLNEYSLDTLCDTPDTLLAEYVGEHLTHLQKLNRARAIWAKRSTREEHSS